MYYMEQGYMGDLLGKGPLRTATSKTTWRILSPTPRANRLYP
jgi:hypothetical protein